MWLLLAFWAAQQDEEQQVFWNMGTSTFLQCATSCEEAQAKY
jgi:hypothetical protein